METTTPPTPMPVRFGVEAAGSLVLAVALVIGRLVASSVLETALLLALTWAILLLLLGRWSDQFNPVVSVWKALTRQLPPVEALVSVVGQFVGAFIGVVAIKSLLDALQVPATAVMPQVNYSIAEHPQIGWIVVTAEAIAALFVLSGYVMAKVRREPERLPLYVALGAVPAVLLSNVFSGAVVNFANLMAVMGVYREKLGYWWGYLVGPLLAVIVMALVMMLFDGGVKKARK